MIIRRKANLDDGCNPELVAGALFDGTLEIPIIHNPSEIIIPSGITPFTEREHAVGTNEAIGFFEKDLKFAEVLIDPAAYIEDFRRFQTLISVDCSMYIDAPLAVQIINLYRSRAIGSYYQRNGCNFYPLPRWGNEFTYTTQYFPEPVAFLGIERKGIVCVGTYGCINSREEKYYFKAGLDAMMQYLEPQVVLVYGAMPDSIFGEYQHYAQFVQYPDWTRRMHGGKY